MTGSKDLISPISTKVDKTASTYSWSTPLGLILWYIGTYRYIGIYRYISLPVDAWWQKMILHWEHRIWLCSCSQSNCFLLSVISTWNTKSFSASKNSKNWPLLRLVSLHNLHNMFLQSKFRPVIHSSFHIPHQPPLPPPSWLKGNCMSGATSNLAAATWLLLQTTLPTTQSSSLDFWELSSEYFILRSFELFFKLSPSFWCRTKASSLHPPSKLAATANITSYITIVIFSAIWQTLIPFCHHESQIGTSYSVFIILISYYTIQY